jgi:hypothetical protein
VANTKRRLTHYLKIKNMLKNQDMEDYINLVDATANHNNHKLNYFFGAYGRTDDNEQQQDDDPANGEVVGQDVPTTLPLQLQEMMRGGWGSKSMQ